MAPVFGSSTIAVACFAPHCVIVWRSTCSAFAWIVWSSVRNTALPGLRSDGVRDADRAAERTSATQSATSSSTSTRTARASSSAASSAASRRATTSSSTSAHRGHAPVPRADAARDVPPRRPHRRLREGHRPRGPRPAGHPLALRSASSSRSSSRPRSPRSTRASCSIVAVRPRAGRALEDRRHARATRTSIRWARASA